MNDLKISVVTVCYNAVSVIEKTILSVLTQTYDHIEYIIIDGASTDGTIDVVKKYSKYIDYYVSEPDNGIYDAMNKGIVAATGDYVHFLNAGDLYHSKESLSYFVPLISHQTVIAYGLVNFVYSMLSKVRGVYPLEEMKNRMPFHHPATFVQASYHKKHLFDTTYKLAGDYDFLYKAYYHDHVPFQHIPIVVADFEAESGLSTKNYSLKEKENARLMGCQNSIRWRLSYLYKMIIYRIKQIVKLIVPSSYLIKRKRKRIEKLY